jgi:hypothetical protein
MSTQQYIRSITEIVPDEFPTLTPLPEVNMSSSSNGNGSFFSNVSWQTWLIIFLLLTLLGINIFAYLAKGTEETMTLFQKVFAPILAFFGIKTLETTKQVVESSATGTKAGVDIVAGATTSALDIVEDTISPSATSGTSVGVSTSQNQSQPKGQYAGSSLPVKQKINETENDVEQWQQNSLEKALQDASQKRNGGEPLPNDSSIPTGKAGWCFIGEESGIRTCSEIGVNDMCMSGDIFPTQAVCMNPNLRA